MEIVIILRLYGKTKIICCPELDIILKYFPASRISFKHILVVTTMVLFITHLSSSASIRVARDKGSDPAGDEANPFWWCDPAQSGYGAFLLQGIKTWCAENASE